MFENNMGDNKVLSSPNVIRRTLINEKEDDGEVDMLTLLTYIKYKSKNAFALI